MDAEAPDFSDDSFGTSVRLCPPSAPVPSPVPSRRCGRWHASADPVGKSYCSSLGKLSAPERPGCTPQSILLPENRSRLNERNRPNLEHQGGSDERVEVY